MVRFTVMAFLPSLQCYLVNCDKKCVPCNFTVRREVCALCNTLCIYSRLRS